MKNLLSLLFTFFLATLLHGQVIWKDADLNNARNVNEERWIVPQKYRTLQLDQPLLKKVLGNLSNTNTRTEATINLAIPLPDGTSQRFAIKETAILHPDLAKKFPNIKTYEGKALNNAQSTIYLDLTPQGFHGMILAPEGTVFIDPYFKNRTDYYLAYYKKDFVSSETVKPSCQVLDQSDGLPKDALKNKDSSLQISQARMASVQLRTYRIAVGANRQYTAFHGGTVAGGLAAITTTMNRVTGVYKDELAVAFQLVPNNDQVIFTNESNDPYSNNANAIDQNTGVLNNAIGSANYDVGHVFTTGSGGVAGLGVICSNSKAAGTTGLGQPTGDPFDIDFVAHELGHQFGGNHTFNGDSGSCSGGNRNRSTAYEPGSGSTIQAYAGICGNDNLQNNSDPYFHLISLNEMRNHVTAESGANCGTLSGATNTTPVANANAEGINGKSIPANTPFELTGSATDANGDALIYNWEQWNLGAQSDINSPAAGAPLFRSFTPNASPTRIFPRLSDILNNTSTIGETLPSGNRTLNFQFIARDNNEAGGYGADMIELNVVGGTGPFKINSPNTTTTLSGTITVTWDVAGTNNNPINCNQVDIFLSVDGGQTFTQQLANDVANNGSASIILPNVNSSTARLKIKCADNVFLDINDANFTITPSTANPCSISDLTAGTTSACNTSTGKYTQQVTVTYANPPSTGNLVINGQSFAITNSPQTVTLTDLTADGNAVNVAASFSANTACNRTENSLFTAPAPCLPVCMITAITAGNQTACVSSTNFYTQEITVTYANPPSTGNLVVNNQTFAITSSPQTVTLTNLAATGNNVNVTASFSGDSNCSKTENDLFQAPVSCAPVCSISDITAGTQTACNTTTNKYTQEVTITYVNPPSSGNLVVNGQNFGITGSPQTVTLTDLNSDGQQVNVTALFATEQNCTFTKNNLFTAPTSCATDLCQSQTATDTPKSISEFGTPTITSTVNLTQSGIITDVNVKNLRGDHTYVYDLDFTLTSPNGTKVLLISEACPNGEEDFDLNVDDNGTASGCPITGGNTYAPVGNLADFNGETASGTWTLTVEDFFDFDGGSLNNWSLEICTVAGGTNCAISSIMAGNQSTCDPNTNTYSQAVTVTYTDPPTTGDLVVNNQTFAITGSPQTVTLTNLPINGMPVNVNAFFSAATSCALTANDVFTAPSSCQAPSCTEINSTDTPKAIPDPFSRVTITSVINVTSSQTLTDVNVKNVRGKHDFVGDLRMELTSPQGTTVRLINRKCDFDEDFDLNFDDDGTRVSCPLTGGNTVRPRGNLSDFIGENPSGNWTLTITDFEGLTGGSLDSWTLELCTGTPPSTLAVNDNPVNSGTYTSCGILTSIGTIPNGNNVFFQANNSITLMNGFFAAAGCNFTAQIEDCANNLYEPIVATINRRDRPNIIKNNKKSALTKGSLTIAPNPTKNWTQVNYALPNPSNLSIELLSVDGRPLRQLLPITYQTAGNYELKLDATVLSAGLYIIQMRTEQDIITKKIVVER